MPTVQIDAVEMNVFRPRLISGVVGILPGHVMLQRRVVCSCVREHPFIPPAEELITPMSNLGVDGILDLVHPLSFMPVASARELLGGQLAVLHLWDVFFIIALDKAAGFLLIELLVLVLVELLVSLRGIALGNAISK